MSKFYSSFLIPLSSFFSLAANSKNLFEFLEGFFEITGLEFFDIAFLNENGEVEYFKNRYIHIPGVKDEVKKDFEYFSVKKGGCLNFIKVRTKNIDTLLYCIFSSDNQFSKEEARFAVDFLEKICLLYFQVQSGVCDPEKFEELALNEEMYRSVFENTGTGTIIIDYEMLILYANQKFCQLTGFKKEELENKMKWSTFVYKDDVGKMQSYHYGRRKKNNNIPEEYECRVIDKEGNLKYIYMKVGMIPGTDKSIASFMDITNRKEAEIKLKESKSQLSVILENFEGLIYIVNENHEIEFMNKALEKRGEISDAGKCFNFLHGFESPCPWCSIDKVFKGEIVKEEIFSPYDNKWYSSVTSPLLTPFDKISRAQTILIDITERKFHEALLKENAENLKNENIKLKSSMRERYRLGNIIGKSSKMQNVYELILKASESSAHVIIYGESGTGKELVAGEIHRLSKRNRENFVPVNCGAISEKLIESEFFGYKKGAFTGADSDKKGFLDQADRGTLFLDEIGEIGLNMQVKLLRAIDGAGYTPVGGTEVKIPDLRIIAATNRDLKELVKERNMREDFFYRIHVIPIRLPALRERLDDIPLLTDHFISSLKMDKKPVITGRLLDSFQKYDWPGNIRELQNIINRYAAIGDPGVLKGFHTLGSEETEKIDFSKNLSEIIADYEQKVILKALEKNRWQRIKTAEFLGIHRKTLFEKIKKYGIE
ncbi:MAG: sigma 54-interacting transcriptional regulator [Desulfobacteraceae bacterium]|nr:sigma 54-interacting transcriptional regulator [Desulfobacteraceae bacterium]